MAALSLSLLGPYTATYNNQPLQNYKTNKVQALLTYLAVERNRPHRRENLFTLLWPGMPEKSARHNLSQTLYTLRQVIPDLKNAQGESIHLLLVDRQIIQLNPAIDATVDIHQLDDLLASTQTHPHLDLAGCSDCVVALENAIALYRDDFLADFYLEDSNQFEEWAEAVRETYRVKLIDILATLSDIAIQQAEYDQALSYIDWQLACDDLNERAHRQKINLLVLSGRRVDAMRHYREFARQLHGKLGTSPSQETIAIYERIQSEDLFVGISKPEKPSLPTAVPHHNLPPQATPFIGRQDELAQLDDMLQKPGIRLITIVAPGGMGKTRLAISCAEQQLALRDGVETHSYNDGIFFIPFAQVYDPEQIIFTIAEAINLKIESAASVSQSPKAQLLHYLRRQQMLLLVDNFEHLIPSADLMVEILQNAPGIKILVTTRERLNLRMEQIFPIGGLLPSEIKESLEIIPGSPAAQLFMQSAQRIQPDFQVGGGETQASLSLICQLVGGMPLALELAAGWVDLLSLEEIADEIRNSLDFLETDLQDVPDRHRAIRAVFDSTWERLDMDERDVFRRFSVFKGGCTREAAQAVTGASLGTLASLVKKSLIQVRKADGLYLIHELIRQYAAEKLYEDPNAEDDTQHAHCTYYCTSLEKWEADLKSARQSTTVSKIKADFHNIRKAWYSAIKNMDLDNLTAAVRSLVEYMDITYQRVEAELFFSRATRKIQVTYGPEPENPQAAWLLAYLLPRQLFTGSLGFSMLVDQVDEKAENMLRQSLALLKTPALAALDTRREQAYIQMCLGFVAHQERRKYLEKSLHLYSALDDISGIAEACYLTYWVIKLVEDIQALLTKNLEQLRLSGDTERTVRTLLLLGYKARDDGNYVRSFQYFDQAYAEAISGGHPIGMANARINAAYLYQFLGKFDEALLYAEEGLDLFNQTGYQYLYAGALIDCGVVEAQRGHFLKAIDLLEEGIAYQKKFVNYSYLALAEAYLHAGQHENAVKVMNKEFSAVGYPWAPSIWLALKEGRYADALNDSRKKLAELPFHSEWYAWVQVPFGYILHGLGCNDEAKNEFFQSLQTCVNKRAFLPLMNLMPILPVVLADCPNQALQERAIELYAMAKTLPFIANSNLFHDIAEKPFQEMTAHLAPEVIEAAQARGQELDWWETAEVLLDELRELGWAGTSDKDDKN